MKTKLLFLLALGLGSTAVAVGEPRIVKGQVLSDSDGEPMIGVAISEKGTTNGTITDADGNFSINVEDGAVLTISYMGYTTQNVKPVGNKPIKIELVEDSKMLDDVVVVGYGTMKKSDITGSVATVNREQMMRKVPTNVGQALQGAAAGVMVIAQDGAPDANTAISIRGIGTVYGDTKPLYVIDGIQSGHDANSLNPGDIESIEVLKDASATAIYGSEGANGVIVITTKHGGKGKTTINVTADFGIQTLPYKIETLGIDEFAKLMRTCAANDGIGLQNQVWDAKYDGKRNYIDWQDQMTRAALKQQYGVSASGGNDKSQYNLSVGYLDHDGLIVCTNYKRLNARLNSKTKVNKYLEVGGDFSYVHSESYGSNKGINNNGNLSSHRDLAFMTPTLDYVDDSGNLINVNVVNPDGSFGAMNATNTPQGWEGNTRIMQNVYATQMESREGKSRNNSTTLSGYADVTLLNLDQHKLNVHTLLSYNHWSNDNDSFSGNHTRSNYVNGQWETFAANGDQTYNFSLGQSQGTNTAISSYLTYKWETDFNNLTVMFGNEVKKGWGSWVNASAKDFQAPNIRQTALASDQDSKKGSGGFNAETRMISYFGRLVYSLKDRYILTATFRKDGSSNFSEKNKWGTFPSVALAWRIKEESFLQDVDWLDNAKVRLGWGQTGNSGGLGGLSVASLETDTYYFYGNGRTMGLNSDHTNRADALYGALVDRALKWETNEQTNFGVDLAFLNSDLSVSLDYYIRDTKDLLVWRGMRTSSGWTRVYTNFGEIRNQGFEFSVNYNKQLTKDWAINVTFNGSTLKNEVTKMDKPLFNQATGGNDGSTLDGSNVQAVDGGSRWDNHSLTKKGESIGSFYGWRVEKIYKDQAEIDEDNATAKKNSKGSVNYRQEQATTVGDYKFKDLNGDGIIDNEDREIIGNGIPSFTFGLNIGATYKNWDMTLYTNGILGQDILSYSAMRLSTTRISDDNTAANLLKDSWKDIQNGKLPRATFQDMNYNCRVSDAWVKNGNFLRLSNLQVGYTMPKKLIKPYGVENVRAYMAISNLALFSPYKKYGDPECGQGSVLFTGLDTGRYPTPRTYMFGLNVSF